MIIYGIAKSIDNREDGTLWIQTRIPNIHGADDISMYNGQIVRNYVLDDDLPWYQSLLLNKQPSIGDTVALLSINNANNEFLIIGVTRLGGDSE